ncbi:hypothetical protein NDI43_20900 [Microcoleus vaginatus GB2-A3]|uniref:hypothetical protein n=1 Tax=Microcoleus vaginatus TaxID=119532 RepID=UPI0032AAC655
MKRKLNLLCYSFGPEAPTRLQNRQECQPRADTAKTHSHLHCLCVGWRMLPLPTPI